jgi:proline iminopeptidase
VVALVFSSVTMTRPSEIHWLYHEAGRFYPPAWQRFRAGVRHAERDGNLVAAYHRLLNVQPDEAIRRRAANERCLWEDSVSPMPDERPNSRQRTLRFG